MNITAKQGDFFPQYTRLLGEYWNCYSDNGLLATNMNHQGEDAVVSRENRRGKSGMFRAPNRGRRTFRVKGVVLRDALPRFRRW
jgi:hypothetical protein